MLDESGFDVESIITKYVQPFGLFQLMIVVLSGLNTCPSAVIAVYLLGTPKFRCKMDDAIEKSFANMSFDEASKIVTPSTLTSNQNNPPSCYTYKQFRNPNSEIQSCKNGYIYQMYDYQYPGSIVKEWDLVCDRSWLVPFSTTMYMIGMMLGFLIGGQLGGLLGRRRAIFILATIQLTVGYLISLSPNYAAFVIGRCVVAASLTGSVTSFSVLIAEFTLARTRSLLMGIKVFIAGCMNRLTVVALAYFFPKWHIFNALAMTFSVSALVFPVFLPESPRWLISMGRKSEAMWELYSAYKINSYFKRRTKGDLEKLEAEEFFYREIEMEKKIRTFGLLKRIKYHFCHKPEDTKYENLEKRKPVGFIDGLKLAFGSRELAARSIFCILLFTGQVLSQFGILFYTRTIKASIYITTSIGALTGIPATLLFTVVYRFMDSRRAPLMTLYGIASIALISSGLYTMYFQPTTDYIIIIFANIGLFLLTTCMNMLYVYIPELFPSDIRTQGLGNSSGFGRVGGIFCDFVNELDAKVSHGFPLVIYGIVLIFQNFLLFFTKDTTGEKLEDISVKRISTKDKYKESIEMGENLKETKF